MVSAEKSAHSFPSTCQDTTSIVRSGLFCESALHDDRHGSVVSDIRTLKFGEVTLWILTATANSWNTEIGLKINEFCELVAPVCSTTKMEEETSAWALDT